MNIAIIGLGGMGSRHLQAALSAKMTPVALCDLSREAAEAAAELPSTPRIYTDWEKMLNDGGFDVLVVATNGPSHHKIILKAAAVNSPYIFCEKPLSTSGAKAREIVAACKKSGTKLAVNLARRQMDAYINLKKCLQTNVIGTVHHINIHCGAGGLGCLGTHFFDLPAWLFDTQPEWVSGTIDTAPAPNIRGEHFFDPGGQAMVGYGKELTAHFYLAGDSTVVFRGELIGTHGYISFDDLGNEGIEMKIFARPKDHWDTIPTRYVELKEVLPGLKPTSFDIIDSTRKGLEDLVSEDMQDTCTGAVNAVDIVMGIHLSAKSGQWEKVSLPLSGNDLNFEIPIT
ncbi:gfo/Idh/MocA family oxidoreductase [Marinifilum sp. JC120]|nr:gfo/Idh/MocA family oxidoreductase [Marinifilum sp. JC120]